MPGVIPAGVTIICPRCKFARPFIDTGAASGLIYICGACEWQFTLAAASPTGTGTAAVVAGGTAITVASGGASFTNGMFLVYDTTGTPEVVVVNGSSSATSIPVAGGTWAGEVRGGFAKAHGTNAAFGQLGLAPTYSATGEEAVPAAAGWGF